jgi:hypothetical protein
MDAAKIRLSQKEMELVTGAGWILTKNSILQKAKHLLEALQEKQKMYQPLSAPHLPEGVWKTPPKISKGENYKGLPYLVLDHPRCFDKENIFAIRTMFWWGNFFSITLHLSGNYKKMFTKKIIASYPSLKEKGVFVCVLDHEWEHHFESSNYGPLPELSKAGFENLVNKNSFVKLAQKIPLQQWDDAPGILFDYFKKMIEMLMV